MQKKRSPFLVLALLFAALPASAQFLIVADKDGFVNVREEPSAKRPITDTLFNGHLVYYDAPAGNWLGVDYKKRGREKSGFIYNNRTVLVDSFEAIPMVPVNKNTVAGAKRDLKIVVTRAPFDVRRHAITYQKENKHFVDKIDGEDFWGTDGDLPKMQYGSITVSVAGKLLKLPATALSGLYQPNIDYTRANWDAKNKTLYIQSMNSDGSGGYLVIWKIVNGVYKERLIATGA